MTAQSLMAGPSAYEAVIDTVEALQVAQIGRYKRSTAPATVFALVGVDESNADGALINPKGHRLQRLHSAAS